MRTPPSRCLNGTIPRTALLKANFTHDFPDKKRTLGTRKPLIKFRFESLPFRHPSNLESDSGIKINFSPESGYIQRNSELALF